MQVTILFNLQRSDFFMHNNVLVFHKVCHVFSFVATVRVCWIRGRRFNKLGKCIIGLQNHFIGLFLLCKIHVCVCGLRIAIIHHIQGMHPYRNNVFRMAGLYCFKKGINRGLQFSTKCYHLAFCKLKREWENNMFANLRKEHSSINL